MLIEGTIGDAFGGGFEYVSPEIVKSYAHIFEYRSHPKHKQITPGRYTDDTQMALAIAEAMLENDPWTRHSLAERFVRVFKRDPRTGYSGGFYKVLNSVNDGAGLLRTVAGNSDRSGGAMRAAPIGLYSDTLEVITKSCIQAAITHCSALGIIAASAASLSTHYFCYRKGPKADLGKFLDYWTARTKEIGSWTEPYQGKVQSKGWMSVKAAVTALIESKSMTELLTKCISFTGDVDTVATIALSAGSLSDEIEQNLPASLYEGLEDGKYGKKYIMNLDHRLMQRTKRP